MGSESLVVCRRCKTRNTPSGFTESTILIDRFATWNHIFSVMDGGLDRDFCTGCNQPLEASPRFVVCWADDLVHAVAPSHGQDQETLHQALLGAGSGSVVMHQDADGLRRAIIEELQTAADIYSRVTSVDEADLPELVSGIWREFNSDVVLYGLLKTYELLGKPPPEKGQDPRLLDEDRYAPERGQVDQVVGRAQGLALERFALAAAAGEISLASELPARVSRGCVTYTALQTLTEAIDRRKSHHVLPEMWALLATAAVAHKASDRAVPFEHDLVSHAAAAVTHDACPEEVLLPAETLGWLLPRQAVSDYIQYRVAQDPSLTEPLDEIAARLGHDELASSVERHMRRVQIDGTDLHELRAVLDEANATGGPGSVVYHAHLVASELDSPGHADMLDAIHDHAQGLIGDNAEMRSLLLEAFAQPWHNAHAPGRLLDRLGWTAPAEEAELEHRHRLAFWRAKSLRALGDVGQAMTAIQPALVDPPAGETANLIEHLHALLVRDLGAPERAARMLSALAPKCDDDVAIQVYEALATAQITLGRLDQAETAYANALYIAVGPLAHIRARLHASRALNLANADQIDDAAAELARIDADLSLDIGVCLREATAWARIGATDEGAVDRRRAREVADHLEQHFRIAAEERSGRLATTMLTSLAYLLDVLEPERARGYWEFLVAVGARNGLDNAEALARVAVYRARAHDFDDMHAILDRLLPAMAAIAGLSSPLSRTLITSSGARSALRELADVLLDIDAPPAALRRAAELQRDTLVRSREFTQPTSESPDPTASADGLSDAVLAAALAPTMGSLWVIEWLWTETQVVVVRTQINARGVTTSVATPPDIDSHAGARLRNRLGTWVPARQGNPLDLPAWDTAQQWLDELLSAASQDDHLVFIPSGSSGDLPWHAARGVRPTLSYAGSWSMLLAGARSAAPGDPLRIGVVSVPAQDEGPEVQAAFAAGVEKVRRVAANAPDVRLTVLAGPAADAAAVRELFAEVDVAVMLCHGYLASPEFDVGLLVAANGQLPLQEAVAAAAEEAGQFRFGWVQGRRLDSAPAVVLSAGCSSGVTRVSAHGDRVGLHAAMRHAGTSTVVAPTWDAPADDVVNSVCDVLARWLEHGKPIGEALRENRSAAATSDTAFLALEGDWTVTYAGGSVRSSASPSIAVVGSSSRDSSDGISSERSP